MKYIIIILFIICCILYNIYKRHKAIKKAMDIMKLNPELCIDVDVYSYKTLTLWNIIIAIILFYII